MQNRTWKSTHTHGDMIHVNVVTDTQTDRLMDGSAVRNLLNCSRLVFASLNQPVHADHVWIGQSAHTSNAFPGT